MFDGDVTLTGQADTWTLLPSLRSPLCGSVPVLKVGVHGDQFWEKVCCCFLPVGISPSQALKSYYVYDLYTCTSVMFVFCCVVPCFWFHWQSQNQNMKRYATHATYATCDILKNISVRSLETRFLALEALLDEFGKVERSCKRCDLFLLLTQTLEMSFQGCFAFGFSEFRW